jgi:phage repressor protein C with HTH and peptisase S24 domain
MNEDLIKAVELLKSRRIVKKDKEIAEKTGYDKSVISNYLSGRVKVSDSFMEKFNEVFKDGLENKVLNQPKDYFRISDKPIPYYDIDISAGHGNLFDDVPEAPTTYFDLAILQNCDGATNAWGDSMYPKIKNRQVIFYKQIHDWKSFIQFGEIYIIITESPDGDRQKMIKYVRRSKKKDYFSLVPENSSYDSFDVPHSHIRKMFLVKADLNIYSV